MIGNPSRHGWGTLNPTKAAFADPQLEPQTGMLRAKVVNGADQVHAGLQGSCLACQTAGAPGQGRKPGAKGGIQPFNEGGVECLSAPTLRHQSLRGRPTALRHAAHHPHDMPPLVLFDHPPNQDIRPGHPAWSPARFTTGQGCAKYPQNRPQYP